MKRGKTLKKRSKSSKSSKKTMTIPDLRKGLDYIQEYSKGLVHSGSKSVSEMASQFAAEWKKVFGKTLSKDTSEAYIRNMFNMKKSYKKTRKHRGKQRGGAQNTLLTGAPMDYMTRPGTDIPYGVFTKHVTSGFWNPEPAIQYDCGTQKGDLPMPGMGSNLMNGGALLTGSPIRPILAENPPSILQDAQTSINGRLLGPGPASYDTAYTYKSAPGLGNTIYGSGAYSKLS